jgi:phage major head subunit gpT-like protein
MSGRHRRESVAAENATRHGIVAQADFNVVQPGVTADGQGGGQPRFALTAYTGRAIRQSWSRNPIVVDLAGMDTKTNVVSIMYGHQYDISAALGQADSIDNSMEDLALSGNLIGEGEIYDRVVSYAKKGWKFQASIGADVNRIENVAAGETVTVNGREFTGPISVVRSSMLREVSVVMFGADASTTVQIAAEHDQGEVPMADEANEKPVEAVAPTEAAASVAVETPVTAAAVVSEEKKSMQDLKTELLKEIKAELLAEVRASRPTAPAAPAVHVKAATDDPKTVVASLCLAGGLHGAEKAFDERTLEAAHARRGEASLAQVVLAAAKANGYTGPARISEGNCREVLKAAFATHSISTILSATYGKFLLNGFTAVESNWDRIASVRSVSDYKSVTGVRVTGGFEFEPVGPTGELKSADAGEETRSIKADLYGRLSSISMVDLVNDDLGALTQVSARLGRGAALRLNKVFWAAFEASNASYYAKETAAAGNAFSLTSLRTATASYRKLKDGDGNVLGVAPRILLVPSDLELPAAEIMSSSLLITGSDTVRGNANVLAGRYQVVGSSYLSSASTWWLCADPMDLPAMEVAFLGGQRQPVVESAEADFNQLGVQIRGHFSFGVAKGEKNGAYRMATA